MKKILSLILSLIITVSLVGCSSNKAVATVNGENITLGNYEKVLSLNKSFMEQNYGYSNEIWSTEMEKGKTYEDVLKDTVLESMAISEVIYQEAKKQGIEPTKDEVQKEINNFKEKIKNNEQYKKDNKEMGINDKFLEFQYSRELANKNLQNKFIKDSNISDKEMKKYYDENKDDFYIDTVTASHILLKTQDDEGKDLSEEKKKEVKKKAEEVLAKAKKGEDFAKLANKYSQDPGSAENGGELGTFGRGEMVSEFEDAAFDMKPGEISELVESSFGYHIIKVSDRVDKQGTFDEVKDEIKNILVSDKYNQYIEKLRNDSKIENKEDIVKSAKF